MAAAPTHGTDVIVGDEEELAEVRWVSLAEADELMARHVRAGARVPGPRATRSREKISGDHDRKEELQDGRVVWRARGVSVGKDPRTGKRRQRTISGPTKKAVQAELNKLGVAVDAGTYKAPFHGLVPEVIASYLAWGADGWEANTRRQLRERAGPGRRVVRAPPGAGRHPRGRRALQGPPAHGRAQARRHAGHRAVRPQRQPVARPAAGRLRPGRAGRQGGRQPVPVGQARQGREVRPRDVDRRAGAAVPRRGGR